MANASIRPIPLDFRPIGILLPPPTRDNYGRPYEVTEKSPPDRTPPNSTPRGLMPGILLQSRYYAANLTHK